MVTYRIVEAAWLLAVSHDSVRRWISVDRLPVGRDDGGPGVIDGADLAAFAQQLAAESSYVTARGAEAGSARNHLAGIVTHVERGDVMAMVQIQAGPHRLSSLVTRESADELGLEPGVRVVASAKATNVVVGVPAAPQ